MSNDFFSVLEMPAGNLAAKQAIKAAGCTHTTVQAQWTSLQPSGPGTALNSTAVAAIVTEYQQAAEAGLKVMFELALQYPPSWVVAGGSAVEQFVDQYATTFTPGDSGSGNYVANWHWTALGWSYVTDLCNKLASALGPAILAQTAEIKIGGGPYGECHLPVYQASGDQYSHWGYGSSMQTGTGLASGQVVCPNPGYAIYSGTTAQDVQWLNWYLGGMGVWLMFFVGAMRTAGWTAADYHVCHPGYGIRNGENTTNTAWRQSAAACEDPERMMGFYAHDSKIWPYCTWLDATDGYDPPGVDSDLGAWKKVYNGAYQRGKLAKLWGENTGGETTAQMAAIFSGGTYGSPLGRTSWTVSAGGPPYGYNGINWLSYASLTAGGSNATLANLATSIAAFVPSF